VGALTGNVTGNISGGTVAGSTGTFTGDVDIADKIVHTGDTNTAIRFPAADTVSVETGASERLRINSDGQLLVGTTETSPFANRTAMFNKNGGNYISVTTDSSNDCGIVFGDGTANTTANYESYIAHSNSTNDFTIYVNQGSNTRYLRIKSATGHVEIGSGNLVLASGAGIDFSATAGGSSTSGTSELLDDYEEGDHTVTVTGSGGQTDVSVYSNETKLSYHRIGNLVIVKGRIRIETNSYSGSLRISLPYTVAAQDNTNNAQMCAVATHGVDFTTDTGTGHHMGMFLEPIQNAAQAEFNIPRDNSSWTQATNSNIGAGSYLAFTLMYNA